MDEKMLQYNALDSACTLEAHNSFWPELSLGYTKTYDFTVRLLEPLMFMMTRGIKVDHAELETTKTEIKSSEHEKQLELDSLCGRALNVASPKDCQRYFYIERGYPPYINRKTGSISTDDDALQRLVRGTASRPPLREAKLVQEIRGLRKLFSTYLDLEFDQDDRLRCSYNPRGTRFGRLSSSKTVFGTGTNLQNLPQAFKKFAVPDLGMFFFEVDKRQAEWVVVAYLSGDANMLDVVEKGRDPHTHTAKLMFRCEEELVVEDNKLVGVATDPDTIHELRQPLWALLEDLSFVPRSMSMRQCGKKSNHGLNYDEGYKTFALTNEMGEGESKVVIDLYHRIYPGIRQWHRHIQQQLGKDRTLVNCFGRKYRFMDGWGDELFKAAYAFLPQSTIADCLNQGIIDIYYDNDSLFEPLEMLAQTHDSCLFQYPLNLLDSLPAVLTKIYDCVSPEMEYGGRKFKVPTDTKIGMNWGGASKSNPNGLQALNDITVQAAKEILCVGQGAK
jgi:DNA polymerase-1